ncbi:flagellar filament capping protein FliD [Lysinibacillus sp. KU-BSD001]|uniref:flagellar filament capping protein FliD n=1 Tax=Lysinibacillus sp. KU-BSD001 TaxID=3141328 RepID=UPI0036F16199
MVNRIGGLVSGMDVDGLVKKMMATQRAPLDKLFQKKQIAEWQRDAYRAVNTKIQTFDTYMADNLVLKELNSKTAASSNSKLVDAKATGSATGTISVEEVKQLASAGRLIGAQKHESATGSTKLSELGVQAGSTIEINAIQSNGLLAEGDTKINITEDMTIDQFISKVNSSNAGVTALFENGRFSFTAKNTGDVKDGPEIVLTGADALGFSADDLFNPDASKKAKIIEGQNALFTVNGIETERTTNQISISGYNLTLKEKFDQDTPVSISATSNIDEMVDKVKDFVKTYNEFVKDLTNQTKETRYSDYPPLTEEQRKELSESEVKLWDEKAKSGLLSRDSILRAGLSNMRSLIYQSNPGVEDSNFDTLFKIGITTTKNYNDGGMLEIDEDKLRKALTENPEAVEQLLTSTGDANGTVTKVDSSTGVEITVEADTRGFVKKIRDSLTSFKLAIETKAGRSNMSEDKFAIGRDLKSTVERMDNLKRRLETIEQTYWKQFTAMEQAMNKASEQASIFM